MRGSGWQIRTCRGKTQTRSSRGILERKWGINCRKGAGGTGGQGTDGSLWLATNSLSVPPHQALATSPSCPGDTQQRPSQPRRSTRNGQAAGAGSWGVHSSRNQGRNKTKRSWQENTIAAVSDRERRLQVLSCRQVDGGQLRPRLTDARSLLRSRGAAWLRGTSLGCPPTAPHLFLGGQKPSHLLPVLFLPPLPLPPSTSPTAWGPHASSPLNPPLTLQLF